MIPHATKKHVNTLQKEDEKSHYLSLGDGNSFLSWITFYFDILWLKSWDVKLTTVNDHTLDDKKMEGIEKIG